VERRVTLGTASEALVGGDVCSEWLWGEEDGDGACAERQAASEGGGEAVVLGGLAATVVVRMVRVKGGDRSATG
jgi:hypothetical protein